MSADTSLREALTEFANTYRNQWHPSQKPETFDQGVAAACQDVLEILAAHPAPVAADPIAQLSTPEMKARYEYWVSNMDTSSILAVLGRDVAPVWEQMKIRDRALWAYYDSLLVGGAR